MLRTRGVSLLFARTGMGVGGGRRTRVEDSTVFKRGKSEMPESRIEIEESRRVREERREVTLALREARDCDCACEVEVVIVSLMGRGMVWVRGKE